MSGEKKEYREAIDKMVRQLVNNGTNYQDAKKRAVESAQNNDKKNQ